jgi:hypothetical protein
MATKSVVRYRNRPVKHHKGGKRKFTLPLAVVAGFTPAAIDLMDAWQSHSHDPKAVATEMGRIFLGWDYWSATWNPSLMKWGTFPIVGGILVHKLANKLGVNRLIASTGIPVIRI